MHCIVLGTDHKLQPSDIGLKRCVYSIAVHPDVKLIAEEVDANKLPHVHTVARDLTSILKGMKWASIDMTLEQQKAAGIYDTLEQRRGIIDAIAGTSSQPNLYFRHADGVREEFWLDRVRDEYETGDVLLICGFAHLDSVASRIEKRGWTATKKLYLPAGPDAYKIEILD